jgi:glycosyltransferase involved in cell wall biosynthesis
MTKLSLVIPALNEEKFLPNLLRSLARQTKPDFEVVVVDGSSKDNTVDTARSFQSHLPGLKVFVSEKARLPLQRNLGARATDGDWLVFIDADSILLPYFIERIQWFIDTHEPMLFTSWFRPDSEVSGDALFTLIANSFVEGSVYFQRPIAPGPLTIVRRDIFDMVGGYNEALTFGEDYEFTQRVAGRGIPLQILRETLYEYSLRRVRRDGKFRFMSLYAKASLRVLFTRKNLEHVPSYIMGGHMYDVKPDSASGPLVRK